MSLEVLFKMIKTAFKKWFRDNKAVAAIEMGMLLPLMLTILMGMFDTGYAVLTSQKVVNASQTVGDLIGRHDVINDALLDEYIKAGELVLQPNDPASYGIDIVGIQFDGDPDSPEEIWRETRNMSPNINIVQGAMGLGEDGEGVIAITVKYTYEPFFTSDFMGTFDIWEMSYIRARSGLFITRE